MSDVNGSDTRKIPIEERFREKVEVDYKTGCWVWMGGRSATGVPYIYRDATTRVSVRQWVLEYWFGITDSSSTRMTCGRIDCVNPDHISADKRSHERFLLSVEKQPHGCWLWTGGQDKQRGEGRYKLDGSLVSAHKAAYELWVGDVPAKHYVRQTCGVKLCVNPDHLIADSNRCRSKSTA